MQYLLDTNILSDAVRNPHGRTAQRLSRHQHEVHTSVVVAAELRYGVEKRRSPILAQKIEELLRLIAVLPLDSPADKTYADLRVQLERAGTPIGANDLFIAAHALALGYTLVTGNEREFSSVPNLKIENWLR